MNLNQIRESFLEFFKQNHHKIISSSSLVPESDPTLLFTNAGMVQFKNYFIGNEVASFTQAVTSQKCIRAGGKHNDLENVGYTARHHTFFEMLGNFSFNGAYFKEHAIVLAWEYLTKILSLDKSRLYITVYHDDTEAYDIWKKLTGFSTEKIIRIATSDNFWSMGDVGPCGPCSEIFFDHGDKYHGGLPGTKDENGDRYIEIWNLVFMQYEQNSKGERLLLPKKAIDTGMGLERITAVMQGVNDNYDTDLFMKLRKASEAFSGSSDKNKIASHKVIADHLRSSCFLIADGVMPSNEGRGYVLRRIMRRAMRHINHLGASECMMYKLVPVLIEEMGDAYPELKRAEPTITALLKSEEEKFSETLERGLKILNSESAHLLSGHKLDGKIAFTLYDTYGFPLDLTKDILRSKGIAVDEVAFDQAMEKQKNRAKAAWVGSGDVAEHKIWNQLHQQHGVTEFLGYQHDTATAKILAIIVDGQTVQSVSSGNAIIVVDKTPFYAESGGQVGDIGKVGYNAVIDVKKYSNGIFGHHVEVVSTISVADSVDLAIDVVNRKKIRANHSATHLLHKALRGVIGKHISQKGSIVTAEKLRFDFSHSEPLYCDKIFAIEHAVNQDIIANHNIRVSISTPKVAMEEGAIALFGEKYGDKVRVIAMGDSVELCGGTHVDSTGDIGLFKIVSEESIASGIRRIEAVTGLAALNFVNAKQRILHGLSTMLKCHESDIKRKISTMQEDCKHLEKKLTLWKAESESAAAQVTEIADSALIIKVLHDCTHEELKAIIDILKKKHVNSMICLVNKTDTVATMLCNVSGNVSSRFQANEFLKRFAQEVGGRGGGNHSLAQLGGCNVNAVDKILLKMKQEFQAIIELE